jgi:hypothetical protein
LARWLAIPQHVETLLAGQTVLVHQDPDGHTDLAVGGQGVFQVVGLARLSSAAITTAA